MQQLIIQAAKLRLPASLSSDVISVIVEQTIDELGLRDAAETVVGGPLRKGISGGEKRYVKPMDVTDDRRLSIGCVLVTLPSVLILDVSPLEHSAIYTLINAGTDFWTW
jgi:ABC-type multidrug transport system ATPase subunit